MAKWKGPFPVTKIPNRFQIEYLDGSVTRLTHISYVKKYNERCQNIARVGMPREKRVSRIIPWVRMARIRLIAGTGRRPKQMVVPSVKAIADRWPIFTGSIRVQVLGDGAPLPADLQTIVDASGSDSCIEGRILVDLCKQRSEEGGSGCNAPAEAEEPLVSLASGCDAPAEAEEPPVPLAPSPKPPVMPVVQVRRYSWHSYAKHVAYDKRWEFVGTNRRTNPNSLLFPQQEPLVSRVHLMKVVRKIGQQERSRGRHLTVNVFKKPLSNGGKDVTSSSLPNRTVKGENISCSVTYNSGISIFIHKYPHINDKCKLKCSKMQEKEREKEYSFSETPDGDGMVTSSNSDVTIREAVWNADVNKLVARKHFVPRKQSFPYSVKSFLKSLSRHIVKSLPSLHFIWQ